jgi:hypothetical protein
MYTAILCHRAVTSTVYFLYFVTVHRCVTHCNPKNVYLKNEMHILRASKDSSSNIPAKRVETTHSWIVWISLESDLLHSCLDQFTASLTLRHQHKFRSTHLNIKHSTAIIFAETLQAAHTLKLCVMTHSSTHAICGTACTV